MSVRDTPPSISMMLRVELSTEAVLVRPMLLILLMLELLLFWSSSSLPKSSKLTDFVFVITFSGSFFSELVIVIESSRSSLFFFEAKIN